MWPIEIPAFVPFFVAALLALVTRGYLRSVLMLGVVALSGLHLWYLDGEVLVHMQFLEYELTPYRVDALSIVFGYVFHIAAFVSILFALHVKDTMQH
ncbi:MAG: Na(+)/H(+) antiporter subunit D, partial [Desulfofustis sp.]|nr:Na(+)/H(+) antiporter subunit D [Desulfofustis sp.]